MTTSLNADIAGFADRVNNLLNEKDALTSDVREVYDEAKEQGVNVKALRKVIAKRRAKTPDPAVVAAMEAYEHALDEAALMVSKGVTLRKAAAETGFSKSAIQRRQASHRNQNAVSGTTHDADGVITETQGGTPAGCSEGTAETTSGPGIAAANHVPPAGGATSTVEMGHGTPDAGIGSATPEISCELDGGKPCPNTCNREGRCVWAPRIIADADLEIPAVLDRRQKAPA